MLRLAAVGCYRSALPVSQPTQGLESFTLADSRVISISTGFGIGYGRNRLIRASVVNLALLADMDHSLEERKDRLAGIPTQSTQRRPSGTVTLRVRYGATPFDEFGAN